MFIMYKTPNSSRKKTNCTTSFHLITRLTHSTIIYSLSRFGYKYKTTKGSKNLLKVSRLTELHNAIIITWDRKH